jgi:hypothetical protein
VHIEMGQDSAFDVAQEPEKLARPVPRQAFAE